MDTLDDSENTAKISDSAYSNSCSNSQSRRSHSSKSTRSGSNSSGSSGYGGKPSTSGYSSNIQIEPTEKRTKDKEIKKKKPLQSLQTDLQVTEAKNEIECIPENVPIFESSKEDINDVAPIPTPVLAQTEKVPDLMEETDKSNGKDEPVVSNPRVETPITFVTSRPNSTQIVDGFSCVISLQDGIVMYTTASITSALGFPKDMWIGRSFIDFVHQRDRNTFASQITYGLAAPKCANSTQLKAPASGDNVSTMVCRIRRYKGLSNGFGVKDRVVTFMPFLLKFFFKNMVENDAQVIYLVIQATPLFSAFKASNEIVSNPTPFVMRHSPSGRLDYIDPESVPYLGYLPQDIVEKDALQLYHPSDLMYLHQVYETIVKEGGEPRSKPYRMLAQNGHYLKLETEWTSFINPWSRKLEFVIGKHFIIEGPTNPDVFQTPEPEKGYKKSLEEETKCQALRENIIRIMNEVLTKPAEVAKQQMSKRCQDLASFMESLLEETPKPEDELRLEIQDADHSCFERDSVMLGGISPHHDNNDSNTSTETTLSYNQLNYNENLQRYFDSHEPNNLHKENNLAQEPVAGSSKCIASNLNNTGESGEKTSPSESSAVLAANTGRAGNTGEYTSLRLTESLLNKHNIEMEKELVKKHRETRASSKCEREKSSNDTRMKKKEHLARCNALFQPAPAGLSTDDQPHGLKRASKQMEEGTTHKHHCSSPRTVRRRLSQKVNNNPPLSATNNVPSPWPHNPVNNMNAFILGLGIPPQMSAIRPMAVPGAIPMYYNTPTSTQQLPSRFNANTTLPHAHYHRYQNVNNINPHMQHMQQAQRNESDMVFQMNSVFSANPDPNSVNPNSTPTSQYQQLHQSNQMQYMMLGQAVYGSPFMYSAMDPQMSYALQHKFIPQQMPHTQPMELSSSNYEEACKLTMSSKYFGNMRAEKPAEKRANKGGHGRDIGNSSIGGASNRNTDAMTDERIKSSNRMDNSDSTNEKTDGESSYSSFYSSFFKTDSGSNDDNDTRKTLNKKYSKGSYMHKTSETNGTSSQSPSATTSYVANARKVPRRKMEPPWMEQVCVTSELIYKYQICAKNIEEVLSSDKEKLKNLEQPSLVSEQLSQLYLDLQLEGVAARLTLEEGITSSSSSGEETTAKSPKCRRRKREYSRLVMIYEEDAPLPPPDDINSSYTS